MGMHAKPGTDDYKYEVRHYADTLIEAQKIKSELKMKEYAKLRKDIKKELSERAKASSSAKNSV